VAIPADHPSGENMKTELREPAQTAFGAVIAAIEQSSIVTPDLAAAALADLRDGVITGEGPSAYGRVHFSRTIDALDAAFCIQILSAPSAPAVTRAEAERLLEIDAVASDRDDSGMFDDLLTKAIAHHALASAGRSVPPRAVALSPQTPLESWAGASRAEADAEVLRWIAREVRGRRRTSRGLMSVALMFGLTAAPVAHSLAGLIDFAA
jgi:hypothetical protein